VCEPELRAEVGCSEGNHETYKEDLRKRKGIDADQPHRVAYKKLVRA
jgi:sulfate-transporting ATPase